MKKKFGLLTTIAFVIALVTMQATVAFAADEPDDVVTTTWTGSGIVTTNVVIGDDGIVQLQTAGNAINGSLTVTDFNNNPYNYQVDSATYQIQSQVADGFTMFQVDRTDSYTPMYGGAGQVAFSYIDAFGGTAEMSLYGSTNYAQMVNATYGKPKTTSGNNFEANATMYTIWNYISANGAPGSQTDNWAEIVINGSGTANVDCMTSQASGVWPTLLGAGGGCYTNADFALVGSGVVQLNAGGTDSITIPSSGGAIIPGNGSYGSCSYNLIMGFTGNFNMADYSVRVD